jgi:hypothetical protein
MLAITYKKITKIKVAEWGTPKKYLKKMLFFFDIFFKLFREVFAVAQLPIN